VKHLGAKGHVVSCLFSEEGEPRGGQLYDEDVHVCSAWSG
jgi:hypothetical protein